MIRSTDSEAAQLCLRDPTRLFFRSFPTLFFRNQPIAGTTLIISIATLFNSS